MEIASTTSSVRAMIDMQAAETRTRQADQAQTFPAPPQTSASQAQPQTSASQAQPQPQPSEVSTEEAAAAARAGAERNRPVVNTSGQLVGTRINTTA